MIRYIPLVLFSFLFVSTVQSQQKSDTLTNKTVLQLKKAGLGDEVIKAKIQSTICNFNLSTDELIAIKKAGLSDNLIAAMLAKNSTPILSAQSSISETGVNSNKGIAPGIYYCKGEPCSLKEIEASVFSQAKMGSGIITGLTYGIAKTKMKSTLSGAKANIQINEGSPVFYFYFDKNSSGNFGNNETQPFLGVTSASSPNEFLLVKFTLSNTQKAREVVTGSWNSYEGISSGIDDNNKIPFKYEKVEQGVYKVYTEKPLAKGQYCFMYAGTPAPYYGSAPRQKAYDFEIE